ncbi:MAG: AbrB/MazE/SpoVT family DNA-binding domain-containing protein [Caldilinea sp.]|nr:AbrB/MazE/SpoVT family DNA-binding domain-containing protein [Caldilinea sp.]MCB0133869.1 AbrB/MazE/SpoVT family DNA-binding domain-containing protein [Caldilineaceae bacterium]MCB0042259.1 AbrB/MazE/SpoVT family DNA-binding domain-containing protein [Caldilinea sp.]MCB0149903.1 AbrB/MazE/SpoVT family DNA-binding domain-containing protein [Caldilineaceae bacterium]MCB9120924.1 AbrB/MazE/SpoVT family DNA-binding domain-containing protein [Caldilineaceae bacterium]
MRVTIKGQVTIPRHIRELLGIRPHAEVEFVERNGRVELVKVGDAPATTRFRAVRGVLAGRTTTDAIMAETRGEE